MEKVPPHENPHRTVRNLQDEYKLLLSYLDPYVTATTFLLHRNRQSKIEVLQMQEFTQGVTLADALVKIKSNTCPPDAVRDFFKKCLLMYQETNIIPDIFGRPHFTGWYKNIGKTPNVICIEQNGLLIPKLVDISFARLSKNILTKGFHNELLAKAISRELNSLPNHQVA